MKSDYYVYLHTRLSDSTIFYVGKGFGRRAWSSCGRNEWWKNTVKKHGFAVTIFKDGLDEKTALALEIELIAKMRKTEKLVNLVDGGGGTRGWKHSQKAKAAISKFNKGKKLSQKALGALKRANKGRKPADETKRKMSDAAKSRPRRPLSEETKRKISKSHMGIRPTPETLKKLSDVKKGKRIGRSSPSYDHTIYKFNHPTHGYFYGTRGDFMKKYALKDGCISSLINGKRNSVKQWRISI